MSAIALVPRPVETVAEQARRAWLSESPAPSSAELAERFGRSPRWARDRIREARQSAAAVVDVAAETAVDHDGATYVAADVADTATYVAAKDLDGAANDLGPSEPGSGDVTAAAADLETPTAATAAVIPQAGGESEVTTDVDDGATYVAHVAAKDLDVTTYVAAETAMDHDVTTYIADVVAKDLDGVAEDLGSGDERAPRRDWIWIISVVAVVAVGGVALVMSYDHMQTLAERAGESWRSYLLPISVDGLMLAASLVILARGRAHLAPGWLPWVSLAAGVAASMAANIASAHPSAAALRTAAEGSHPYVVARVIAAWPPVAALIGIELLMRQIRTRHDEDGAR